MEAARKADLIAKEYEDFAYIVSHDLNAPLRHVKEFTRLLVGARREGLSEEEKGYVEYLEKSLQRLDKMQEALLAFSRLNTRSMPYDSVDCNAVMQQVLKDIDAMIAQHKPEITCGDLPTIVAEPSQMRLLFVHLIDNALKFHAPGVKRKISVKAETEGEFYIFEIADNGIGIAPEFRNEAFRLFRRLNPETYPGSGAGLTIAQKIVQRHGGDIRIESADGGPGTRIIFTLPLQGG